MAEVSKRSLLLGGVFTSLPVVSSVGIIWLYVDTGSTEKVAISQRVSSGSSCRHCLFFFCYLIESRKGWDSAPVSEFQLG